MKDFKPYLQDILLVGIPVLLVVNIVVFRDATSKLHDVFLNTSPTQSPLSFRVSPYPQLSHSSFSSLSSASFIVLDRSSGVVIAGQNQDAVFSMASTTKIMTALVAVSHFRMDDVIEIKSTNVPSAVVGFDLGEKVYFKDVLYGMLLDSGNDAALALAQNYPGGEEAFIETMNAKAVALQLKNTFFADSSGLSSKNKSTAFDLARLTNVVLENRTIAKIVGTKQYSITDVTGSKKYALNNLNKLLGEGGVNGVKTGFTKEAGEVLVTSRLLNGHSVLVVVMKSDNRFLDTQSILSTIDTNIAYLTL